MFSSRMLQEVAERETKVILVCHSYVNANKLCAIGLSHLNFVGPCFVLLPFVAC